jgi:AraC-like DNA-binding protein
MEITFDFVTFINLAALILGIASGLVILYQSIKTNPTNLPLALGQITVSLAIWVNFLIVSKLLVYWPFLFRTGSLVALLYVPLPFLYLSFYIQKRTWRWYDFLHFIPFMVFLVDFWPIYILSNQEKLALILRDLNDQNKFALLRESRFFPPGFHQAFRVIVISLYWLVQCLMLHGWIKKQAQMSYEDRIWKNWMIVYLFFQAGLWIPFYLTFVMIDKSLTYHLVYNVSALWIVVSSFLMLLYPSLLYGYQPIKSNQKAPKSRPVTVESGPGVGSDDLKMEEVKKAVDQGLDGKTLYLKPGLTINEFSKDIGIPVYQISKCITQYSGMGFIDFINQKRVQYCAQKLDSGDWKHFKVEAIAKECGFNNRNSFTNAFKKFMGISPSEYKSGNTSPVPLNLGKVPDQSSGEKR